MGSFPLERGSWNCMFFLPKPCHHEIGNLAKIVGKGKFVFFSTVKLTHLIFLRALPLSLSSCHYILDAVDFLIRGLILSVWKSKGEMVKSERLRRKLLEREGTGRKLRDRVSHFDFFLFFPQWSTRPKVIRKTSPPCPLLLLAKQKKIHPPLHIEDQEAPARKLSLPRKVCQGLEHVWRQLSVTYRFKLTSVCITKVHGDLCIYSYPFLFFLAVFSGWIVAPSRPANLHVKAKGRTLWTRKMKATPQYQERG